MGKASRDLKLEMNGSQKSLKIQKDSNCSGVDCKSWRRDHGGLREDRVKGRCFKMLQDASSIITVPRFAEDSELRHG